MGSVTSQQKPPRPAAKWVWRLVMDNGKLVKKLVQK